MRTLEEFNAKYYELTKVADGLFTELEAETDTVKSGLLLVKVRAINSKLEALSWALGAKINL